MNCPVPSAVPLGKALGCAEGLAGGTAEGLAGISVRVLIFAHGSGRPSP
jgi:hypothetical protein